jgi:hypothetical protein
MWSSETEAACGNLSVSVRMRAPFAPSMSCGSRATQVKPEALVILFRANPLKPLFYADVRKSVCACGNFPVFDEKIFFCAPWTCYCTSRWR